MMMMMMMIIIIIIIIVTKLQFFKNFSADPSAWGSTRGKPSLEKPAQDVLTAQLRKLSATKEEVAE